MGLEIEYLEGQTPLDEEEIEGLKIKSITTRGELDEFEQQNIEKAIEWTFGKTFKAETILSERFIKDLHSRMFRDVWLWAGHFRKTEKNIGVAPHIIGVSLKQLCDDCLFWIEQNIYAQEEIAVRFKHRIVSIHCFSNGNGRHSRLIADIMINAVFKQSVFSWGSKNLNKTGQERAIYLSAVKAADKGNIAPLIAFART